MNFYVFVILAFGILGIIYINRPQCVQQGEDCTSSSVGCCDGLYCNKTSQTCEYNYVKNENFFCDIQNYKDKDSKDFIYLRSDATNKTKEEFIKNITDLCDKCRNNPDSCPNKTPIKTCNGFVIVDDPSGKSEDTWQKGVAPLCDSRYITSLNPARKGVDTYTIVQ